MSVHKKCIPEVPKNCRGTPMQNSSHGKNTNTIKENEMIEFLLNR